MQGRPAHLRRRARVRGLAPDFVCDMTKQRTKSNKSLWVLLGGALLLRLVLALVTDGYPYDMSCFVAWGDKLAAEGPAAFYSDGYFADYPPGYLWVLGLVGAIRAALHIAYESKWTYFLLAFVPSLCDCGLAWLVYRAAKCSSRGVKEHTALVLTTHYLEEAEALSDRIGIMSHGHLIALGTAQELIEKTGESSFENAFIALAGEGDAAK